LNQIWWGRFVDASPVWTGQGSGEARVLGRQRVALPNGPAFAVLADAGAAWPTATRRELGQRWLGYDLDAQQRPSFRYVCAGVEVTDTPVEVPAADAGLPALRRTLRFASQEEQTLTFRAALASRIEQVADDAVRVGPLSLRLPAGSWRIRPAGEQQELLVEIRVGPGSAELVLEYGWREAGK
ncbi:MAG TPA: hypothetical protein VFZ65_08245, partial [Planctomycetota bacterium]|nr:hypothetical protein [Planctomycetota bacterium]